MGNAAALTKLLALAVPSTKADLTLVTPYATQLVSATGKIRPKVEVKISPEVAGEIIAMPVVVGQKVKKGDLLVKIKPDNYIAAVKQTVAALSAAEAASLQIKAQMLNDELDLRRRHLLNDIDDLLSLATDTLREPPDDGSDGEDDESQADGLVRIGSAGRLFSDSLGAGYARIAVDGEPCTPPHERVSGSDLLSSELDEFGRDPVYEAAAARAVG